MSRIDEQLSEQFFKWEMRGRGWTLYERPVQLEPPFQPFFGYTLTRPTIPVDDGRKHTRASGFLDRLRQTVQPLPPSEETADEEEPEPFPSEARERVELQLSLPLSRSVPGIQVESFLRHIARPSEPLALELLGTERETFLQWVASPQTVTRVQGAIEACFPGIVVTPSQEGLPSAWNDSESHFAVVELGLGRESMLPLGKPRHDLLAAVVTAMDWIGKGELGLFQMLLEPVQNDWMESMVRIVSDEKGKPLFENRPDLVSAATRKIASPLFAVVIRLVSSAATLSRAWEIIADLAAPFSAVSQPGSNYFKPLSNEGYASAEHEENILNRQSRRCGMLLNMEEVMSFISPPMTSTSGKLRRETKPTRLAPETLPSFGLSLGLNKHAGLMKEVFLSPEHRVRHTHVIGASGTGKTTFLLSLIRQDIENGAGLAVFDPHGDLIDSVLGMIPQSRMEDVIVLDPSDEEHIVGLNILAAHSDSERSLLASDLTSVFRRLSTSWGDQMESVLRNGILAFLESSRGGSLNDLRRFLIDAAFRKDFLQTVTDPEIVYYWTKAFPLLTGGKSIGPLLTRLDEFLSRKPIRYMVSQTDNRLDFADILDSGKILLIKLPQGLIGRENTALLGSLITAKLQMAAMNRQRMPSSQRRDFWCYMDEFQNFITPSMSEILAGARKYRLGMILAHQELRQLEADRDLSSAVLANCNVRVVFKVSDGDARSLESGFSHFEARDLMNLGVGEALCRVERSDFDFNLTIPNASFLDEDEAANARESAIAHSRARYARPRSEIEAELFRKRQSEEATKPPVKERPAKEEAPPKPETEPPKVSEAPLISENPTSSEKESSPEPETKRVQTEPVIPSKPPTLGRGGATHKDLQMLIKTTAESVGFRATLEYQTPDKGSVDVFLERAGLQIACEISVTTRVEHEVGNILKCVAAGYPEIALISSETKRLEEIAEALKLRVSETELNRVRFYSSEEFFAYLKNLAQIEVPEKFVESKDVGKPPKPKKKMVKGWEVVTKISQATPEESKIIEDQTLKMIAETLRKKI